MVSYDSSVSDQTGFKPLRILVLGERLDSQELDRHLVRHTAGDPGEELVAHQPDILILDAALIDANLRQTLAAPRFHGLPIILIAGANEADAAGTLLDAHIATFVPPYPPVGAIAAAVTEIDAASGHVADAGTHFDPQTRIEELRRDAERMAAAIAELAAGRPQGPATQRPVDAPRIRAHIKARRLREKFFAPELFADPAWDMLLDLSAARLEGRQVSVSSLCIAATVPTTTGLRWIKTLVDRGVFERHSDPQDARRAFIAMSPATTEAMTACLDAYLNTTV